ncbi:hypothetical protein Csa_021110 [Cucumis sativus]|nr:hypothetical protein Csa_021110 [Cucumis sativus]
MVIIAANLTRILLLSPPHFFEDFKNWKKEIYVKCTYNAIPLAENEFPQNWLTDGIQIKILFPFRLQSWNREESISNNRFYYGTAHDVHIDLLCASASSIGIPSPIQLKETSKTSETAETEESEEETDVEIETTSETKGTKQEQEGSTEEDTSPSLFSEEKEDPDKINETKEI